MHYVMLIFIRQGKHITCIVIQEAHGPCRSPVSSAYKTKCSLSCWKFNCLNSGSEREDFSSLYTFCIHLFGFCPTPELPGLETNQGIIGFTLLTKFVSVGHKCPYLEVLSHKKRLKDRAMKNYPPLSLLGHKNKRQYFCKNNMRVIAHECYP